MEIPGYKAGDSLRPQLPRFWSYKEGSAIAFELVGQRDMKRKPKKGEKEGEVEKRWDAKVIRSENAVDQNGKDYQPGEMVTMPGLALFMGSLEKANGGTGAKSGDCFVLTMIGKEKIKDGEWKGKLAWNLDVKPLSKAR